jgi:hypothetical protein
MNIYYEFMSTKSGKLLHRVRYNRTTLNPHRLTFQANRIWIEDDNGVSLHKDSRMGGGKYDPKEFLYIKLSSTTLEESDI